MKKILTLLSVLALTFSLAACGNNSQNSADNNQASVKDALTLLNTVWDSYDEADKFPAAGGDMSEDNSVENAPGKFGIDNSENLDVMLGFPASFADKIDDAASLFHMMNSNTFTCGAFHVKDSANISEIADAVKENIMNRQWMCGFPDKFVIASVDDYIVAFFGAEDLIDTFKDKLSASYSSTNIICDEPIL